MSTPLLLLVDDAPDLGAIVAYLARKAGCEAVVRRDVEGGWEFLQHRRPDLLLLDVNLPGASGLELCRRIRATPATAALPVALFTIWTLPGDVAAGIDAGADFVFSKDLIARPPDWRRRLEEILTTVDGRTHPPSLFCLAESERGPPTDWRSLVNQTLGSAALRGLGPDVRRALLRRVLALVFADSPPAERDGWLAADDGVLDPDRAPRQVRPGAAAELARRLAEQTWRLLGTEASASIWPTPGVVVPDASPPRSRR